MHVPALGAVEGHVVEGNGPVDEQQVDVLEVEVLAAGESLPKSYIIVTHTHQQGLLDGRAHVLLVVVRVVEFAGDEQLLALDRPRSEELMTS